MYELECVVKNPLTNYDELGSLFTNFHTKIKKCNFIQILSQEIAEDEISCSFELKVFDSNAKLNLNRFSYSIRTRIEEKDIPSKNYQGENLTNMNLDQITTVGQLILFSPGITNFYIIFKILKEIMNEISEVETTYLLKIDILKS